MPSVQMHPSPEVRPSSARPRVALVCDFVEEKWPSMDLVAEMLSSELQAHHSSEFNVERLCPPMAMRFSRVPGLGERKVLRNADRLANRFFDYPRWLRRRAQDFDLFHLVDHTYAQLVHELPAERTVVTCHDLDAFRCLLNPDREKRPRWFRAMIARVLEGLQRAAHIITVSYAVRDQLLQYAIVPSDRISVIPNGLHPSCRSEPDSIADSQAAGLLPNVPGALWLLNVGSMMRRKRLDVLLQVLAAVREDFPQVRLIRVGGQWTPDLAHMALDLGVEQAIVDLPFLSRPALAAIYRRADLLVHTADAEGFGLPLIEAQASGCPVVASDLPVLREVGGTAACYAPVGDIAAWKQAVAKLLRERIAAGPEWRDQQDRSLANAARYSWTEAAARTADLYRSVLERAGSTLLPVKPELIRTALE